MQEVSEDASYRDVCESGDGAHGALNSKLSRELRVELNAAKEYVLGEADPKLCENTKTAEACKKQLLELSLFAYCQKKIQSK